MNDLCKLHGLEATRLPRHLGVIMDGNGRWAKARHSPRLMGHRKGVERVREIVEFCGNLGVEALTLYAFSDENWRRPEEEVNGLMGLLRWYLRNDRKRIIQNNVRFRVIGDRLKLSSDIVELIEELEHDTRHNTGMHLAIALSYGSHGEMIRAFKRLVGRLETGEILLSDIDETAVEGALDTAGMPPVDMLVRTSGESRISNFLLWQLAYAELFFEETYWPDFTPDHLVILLRQFAKRERRFGMTSDQVQASSHVRQG